MSYISFASRTASVELRGSERAHMGIVLANLAVGAFSLSGWKDDPIFRAIPLEAARYQESGGALTFARDFKSWLSVGGDNYFLLPESRPETFSVILNTALAIGNDALRLFARLHGQCELHAWIDGPNRAWAADIIDTGRAAGLYRADQGWEAVAKFLRSSKRGPVVTSYSVCDTFPESGGWDAGIAKLRASNDGREITPTRWAFPDFHFGANPDTAFSVYEAAWLVAKALQGKPSVDPAPGGALRP